MKSLVKVWFSVIVSLSYVYFNVSMIRKGKLRLLSLLPVIALFTIIPMCFSTVHFCGFTGIFLTWLCNFRLLLFAFEQGPLSTEYYIPGSSFMSFLYFVCVACLPIKIKDQHSPQIGFKPRTNYAIKTVLLAIVICLYNYKKYLHPDVALALQCVNIYLTGELILLMCAAPAQALLRIEIEPQFDEPYLSTSLQDFWGKRWNLIIPSILRPTVYQPLRDLSTPTLGRTLYLILEVTATYIVSGLMHELLYYYILRVKPTWEVTMFFVLHGFCLLLEIMIKKAVGNRWRLPLMISRILTIGFVLLSGCRLFFPQLMRHGVDVKVNKEYGTMYDYVRDNVLWFINK